MEISLKLFSPFQNPLKRRLGVFISIPLISPAPGALACLRNNKRRCQDTPFAFEVYSKMTTEPSKGSACLLHAGPTMAATGLIFPFSPDLCPLLPHQKVNALLPLSVLTTYITGEGENSCELREVQSVREQGWAAEPRTT